MNTPAGHPPICRDCAHYRPSHLAIYPRCARNASYRADLVTGDAEEIGLLSADLERMSERAGHLLPANRCTEAGIYFKPAPVIARTRIHSQPEPSALLRLGRWIVGLFTPPPAPPAR